MQEWQANYTPIWKEKLKIVIKERWSDFVFEMY